jgi:hypothetical protein
MSSSIGGGIPLVGLASGGGGGGISSFSYAGATSLTDLSKSLDRNLSCTFKGNLPLFSLFLLLLLLLSFSPSSTLFFFFFVSKKKKKKQFVVRIWMPRTNVVPQILI